MSQQVVAAAAFLILIKRKKRKHRWWTRQLYIRNYTEQNAFFEKLLADDEALFKNFSRMSSDDFNYLLQKVSPIISKCDTNYRDAIPAKVRLLLTLRFLASGDSYESLKYLFKIAPCTISKIVPEVCQALIEALKAEIKVSLIV